MHIKLLSALSFFIIWLCIMGVSTQPMAIAFALIVPLLTFLISVNFGLLPKRNIFSIKIFAYNIWLFKEIFFSTLNVIKIAWRPHLRIIPVIEPLKSIQTSDSGMALYANSITLTPGTVTLNVIGDALLVHALDVSMMEELKEGVMDKKIAEVMQYTDHTHLEKIKKSKANTTSNKEDKKNN